MNWIADVAARKPRIRTSASGPPTSGPPTTAILARFHPRIPHSNDMQISRICKWVGRSRGGGREGGGVEGATYELVRRGSRRHRRGSADDPVDLSACGCVRKSAALVVRTRRTCRELLRPATPVDADTLPAFRWKSAGGGRAHWPELPSKRRRRGCDSTQPASLDATRTAFCCSHGKCNARQGARNRHPSSSTVRRWLKRGPMPAALYTGQETRWLAVSSDVTRLLIGCSLWRHTIGCRHFALVQLLRHRNSTPVRLPLTMPLMTSRAPQCNCSASWNWFTISFQVWNDSFHFISFKIHTASSSGIPSSVARLK